MNFTRCPREGETVRALRSGSPSPELFQHGEHCPDCCQARLLAQVLAQDAARLQGASPMHAVAGPPPAMQLWPAVQRRQRFAALERATLFLRVLTIAGLLYAAVFLRWILHVLTAQAPETVLPSLSGKALTDSIAGAGFAAILVCTGLLYALRGERVATR